MQDRVRPCCCGPDYTTRQLAACFACFSCVVAARQSWPLAPGSSPSPIACIAHATAPDATVSPDGRCVVLGRVGAQGARRAARPHQPDYNQTNRVREMVLGSEGESERYL